MGDGFPLAGERGRDIERVGGGFGGRGAGGGFFGGGVWPRGGGGGGGGGWAAGVEGEGMRFGVLWCLFLSGLDVECQGRGQRRGRFMGESPMCGGERALSFFLFSQPIWEELGGEEEERGKWGAPLDAEAREQSRNVEC